MITHTQATYNTWSLFMFYPLFAWLLAFTVGLVKLKCSLYVWFLIVYMQLYMYVYMYYMLKYVYVKYKTSSNMNLHLHAHLIYESISLNSQ